ncbi:glycoside hydrolase family 16 protein [Cadophora sp. MPI-SDFR-AT-0126]|nr:glycoside hydrolase family 16 protein [Leotiomycetes sp. MPI-SDFR-AT-0126]
MLLLHSIFMILLALLALSISEVGAFCQCGYRSLIDATLTTETSKSLAQYGRPPRDNINTSPRAANLATATPYVWTDLLETDFLHLDDIAKDSDWQRQNYSVTAQAARGPYGMQFDSDNVKLNRINDPKNWTGPGELGGNPGLQLTVGAGSTSDGFTRCAQLNTAREDMLWGSYRALLKLPSVSGTCSAFFWYFNDSQEIDMELLSSQFDRNNNSFLINLVHQSPQSASQGFSVIGKDYKVSSLPFDPTTGFHEYRIDYLPDQILFYGDGQVIGVMNSTVSPQPGHLILTHWSNGDAGWSAGPPLEPATLSVGYVKAYFNSSNPSRQADASRRCTDPNEAGAICDIEDYTSPINISSSKTNDMPVPAIVSEFFFNRPNMTANQTVYRNKGPRVAIAVWRIGPYG